MFSDKKVVATENCRMQTEAGRDGKNACRIVWQASHSQSGAALILVLWFAITMSMLVMAGGALVSSSLWTVNAGRLEAEKFSSLQNTLVVAQFTETANVRGRLIWRSESGYQIRIATLPRKTVSLQRLEDLGAPTHGQSANGRQAERGSESKLRELASIQSRDRPFLSIGEAAQELGVDRCKFVALLQAVRPPNEKSVSLYSDLSIRITPSTEYGVPAIGRVRAFRGSPVPRVLFLQGSIKDAECL